MADKNISKYSEDGFYQYINEHHPHTGIYKQVKKILESGFDQDKVNYLLLAELILAINELNDTLKSIDGGIIRGSH